MKAPLPPTLPNLLLEFAARGLILTITILLSSCANGVLLDERFHDPRLINWSVVDDPDTIEGPSEWRVESDGWVHQRSNIWGLRGDFLGRWYGTYLVAGDVGWSDYTFSVKAKPSDDDGFGLVFRYQDAEHFYRLLFLQDGMSGGPMTRLDRREGADYRELWSTQKGYRPGNEMMIEVEVEGEAIRASMDGRQLFEVKDGSYRRGEIGLFCFAQKGQAFDDVKVVER
ncbi:MAG TPA: hypothetical protein VKF81_01865 [Blastocatellia bacterium]|nr:hypothetical protein [Blastocatellia bacterium]